VKNDAPIDEKKQEQETPKSLLEELIREGARRLLQAAIEQEVTEYLERFREEKDDKGHRMVVRNGRLPERMFVTGVGPLRIHQPRIRDKREGETFTSAILLRCLRRVLTIDTLLPVLYLKGISTGDMMPALEALLGPHTPGPLRHKHHPLEESLGDGVPGVDKARPLGEALRLRLGGWHPLQCAA